MTHRLLISEAGGALSNGVIESLYSHWPNYPEYTGPGVALNIDFNYVRPYLVGVSSDVYALQLSKCAENYLIPEADEPNFVAVLNQICDEHKIELIISQHDSVIRVLSEFRDQLHAPVFLPRHDVIVTCQDKQLSNWKWHEAGLRVPRSIPINDEIDLEWAFRDLGPNIWLRARVGGFGKGALPTNSFDMARMWIDAQDGWGKFHAAEPLGKNSVTWLSIWKDGELIVAQGRKRHYWKYHNRNLSGVTGITGVGETVSDTVVDDTALAAIYAVDNKPHGIYSVDMTYGRDGRPNPTEINIGRFFTTHLFFAKAGLNVSEILVNTFFGEPIQPLPRKINPLEPGLCWAREMDVEPALVRPQTVVKYQQALKNRLKAVNNG